MSGSRTRRRTPRRFDLTGVLAVALPVVTAGALALTVPDGWSQTTAAPEEAPLTSAVVLCPAPLDGATQAGVTTVAEGARGTVVVRGGGAGADGTELDVSADRPTGLPEGRGELSVRARGEVSAGLVAGRARVAPLAATDCPAPAAEQWFTGLGAGPQHGSTIELVNPNQGTAVVDVEVLGEDGPVEVDDLRGVAVPGHSARTFDLAEVMPRLGDLAVRTTVVRGQAAVVVRDRTAPDVDATAAEEWLAGQAAPAATSRLLGLPRQGRSRVLTVANGGDSQVSLEVKVVTPDAVLAPTEPVAGRVAPGSVASFDVADLLGSQVASDAIGLQVEATGPVSASLRSDVAGDPAITPVAAPVQGRTALVLPVAPSLTSKSLALSGADAEGTVTVVTRDGDGAELGREDVELAPGSGAELALPRAAAVVELLPDGTSVAGAVRVSGQGVAVVPFRQVPDSARVPAVAPGLS